MLDKSLPHFKCGGVLESVTGSFVGNDLHVNYALNISVAVSVYLNDLSLCSVGNENREVAKVIDMVVDRLNAKRAHAGDNHRSPERKRVYKRLGADSPIVKRLDKAYSPTEGKAGELSEKSRNSVGSGIVYIGHCRVELLVNVVEGIVGIKHDLDTGLGS